MSKIQDVPFISKVIGSLTDELKADLLDLINGDEKTPALRSLINNTYAITDDDKGKVQFVTLETYKGNYTGYLIYNASYCELVAFKGNTQALDQLYINVAKHTFSFVNEALTILELRTELIDSRAGADVGALQEEISNIKDGTTHLFENITDKHGNPRFIEGDITMETIEGVTQTYGKWSLSGTHLMVVFAGKIASGTTLSGGTLVTINVPRYILDKVIHIIPSRRDVIRQRFPLYTASANVIAEKLFYLDKQPNNLNIGSSFVDPVTTSEECYFRIQFDLLIDDE
jgi:hypothetical protein